MPAIAQSSIGIVFNALSLASYNPQQFKIRQYPDPGNGSVLDLLMVDGTLQETIVRQAEVTDHPVEVTSTDVSSVSDHVRLRPIELKLEGVISDTPVRQSEIVAALQAIPPAFGLNFGVAGSAAVGFAGGALGLANQSQSPLFSGVMTRSQQAYETLRDIFSKHQLVTLVTVRDSFDSMMMTDFVVPRDIQNAGGLRFSANFKQVITTQAKTTQLPVSTQPAFDVGNQPTVQAPSAAQDNVSKALKLWKASGVPLPDPAPKGWSGPRFFK
jgi:hypothetical protein